MRRFKLVAIIIIVSLLLFVGYYFLINYSFHFLTEMFFTAPDKLSGPGINLDNNGQVISDGSENSHEGIYDTENRGDESNSLDSIGHGKNDDLNENTDERSASNTDIKKDDVSRDNIIKESGSENSYNKIDSSIQEKIEKNVSIEDKRAAIRLVVSKLTNKDIALLFSIAKGGLTEKEKEDAIKLAYMRFTPEELKRIKQLYNKYIYLLNN